MARLTVPAEVKILLEGYVSTESGGRSCSTISLVRDGALKIVCDPGTANSAEVIEKALAKERLDADGINVVFITHNHMDHHRFTGLFRKAKILDFYGWWDKDACSECGGFVSENIHLIKTPGHSHDSVSLIVETAEGIVAVCGDVFWKQGFPKRDPYACDLKKLAASRKKILEIADFVVPGHGETFKAKKWP